MKLETILVGVDFSDESQTAVEQAVNLGRKSGARVILLHVAAIPEVPMGMPASLEPTFTQYKQILTEHLTEDRKRLDELRERVASHGAQISHMVIDGLPDEAICRAADEVGADLVVVGSHGRTGLKRLVLGSVSEKVVRLSHKSVLVARPTPEHAAGGYRKILVATDFSRSAEKGLVAALELAAPGAELDILYCWYIPPASYTFSLASTDLARPIEDYARQLGSELLAKHGRPDVTLSFHTMESPPTRGILEMVEQGGHSLLVTGSHGYRGIRRLVLGSVAEAAVRHSPCSVLVVHDPQHAADTEAGA